ncbi:CitMHS family transporter [Pandoraea sputorum]|uniref:Citrate transporter n=1 Tax=Pandoraea sputorum TaxID=93222 RepID=A0A239S5T7_9BURK|nr:citrate:proton symporter [Pandoraea sputorum]AJC15476.1 citrate transporter [Pandoraea sputorum]SNU80827.1 Citrate transporter [Pandoraea sputorum]
MLTAVGVAIIVVVVGLLLTRRSNPIVGLTLVPLIGAALAGFGVDQIGAFFSSGLLKVMPVAAMFMFAIVFFGVVQDAGLFRPLLRAMLVATRGNVIAVTVGTALLGMVAHLDGAGATTFLLTIPALLPLYRRLNMSPYLMLMLLTLGAGIFNMTPWAGPLGRAAVVSGIEATELWRPLIAIQGIGVVLLVMLAVLLGLREAKRARALSASGVSLSEEGDERIDDWRSIDAGAGESSSQKCSVDDVVVCNGFGHRRLMWLNGAIFVMVLAGLVTGALPSTYVFMIGLAVALSINFPNARDQIERIKMHAPNALVMSSIIMAAGAFLGIMDGSGMLKSMAGDLTQVLPTALTPHLHLVLGFFGAPMELVLSTDAYYFGLLPVVQEVVSSFGVSPSATLYAMTIGNIVGTFISPFSPALWLALGLANLEMGRHIRYSLLTVWGFSVVLLGCAVALGRIPISM